MRTVLSVGSGRQRRSPLLNGSKAAVLVGMLIMASACGSELFPVTQRVDPDALGQIRTIGKVLVESDSESTSGGVTKVRKILVIGMGNPDKEGAVSAASKLLKKRGWAMVTNKGDSVYMKSHKWDDIGIMIKGMVYYDSHDGIDSIEMDAIKTAQMRSGPQGIVVLEVDPIDG